MSTEPLPHWPPVPLSKAASPPDNPVVIDRAREDVLTALAKFEKASDATARDRAKHPTDVSKLTTASGRAYRALHKLRTAYTTQLHHNAFVDDEIHLMVTARNLSALQTMEELDTEITALVRAERQRSPPTVRKRQKRF